MNILFVSGHPAQVHNFRNVRAELIKTGHKVFWLTTPKDIATNLLDVYQIPYNVLYRQLLHMVQYFGLGEVEWMYDPMTEEYKFLEINTRAWKWHTISNQLGFSFIGAMIDHYNGVSIESPVNTTSVGWVERLTDWTISIKEILHGKTRFSLIKQSYKIKKENAVWRWTDPLPGIMYMLMAPILYIRRY